MSNTQQMKIFEIIADIKAAIEDSPRPKLSSGNKRILDADLLFDLLGDLQVSIPEDVRRANSVLLEADNTISNAKDAAQDLLVDAQNQADGIVSQAQQQAQQLEYNAQQYYEQLVSEHTVLEEAQKRAQLLDRKAEHNATVVYDGAKRYADEILADVQRFLGEYQYLIGQNRDELGIRSQPQPEPDREYQQMVQNAYRPAQEQQEPMQPVQPAAQPMAAQPVEAPQAIPQAAKQQPVQRRERPVQQPAAAPAPQRSHRPERQPVQPVQPQELDDFDDEDDEEVAAPKSKFFGWFSRKNKQNDDFDDEFDEESDVENDEEFEEEPVRAKKKKQRKRPEPELDLDLDLDE